MFRGSQLIGLHWINWRLLYQSASQEGIWPSEQSNDGRFAYRNSQQHRLTKPYNLRRKADHVQYCNDH